MYDAKNIFDYLLTCPDIDVNEFEKGGVSPLYLALYHKKEYAAVALLKRSDVDLNVFRRSVSLFELLLQRENCCDSEEYQLLLARPDLTPDWGYVTWNNFLKHALHSGNLRAVYDIRHHPKFCVEENKKSLDKMKLMFCKNASISIEDFPYLEGFDIDLLARHLYIEKKTKSFAIVMKHKDFNINHTTKASKYLKESLIQHALVDMKNIPGLLAIIDSDLLSKKQTEYVRQWAISNGYIDIAMHIKKPSLWKRIFG